MHKGEAELPSLEKGVEIGALRQALPLRRGAPEYLGWFEHPDFGGWMRMRLTVMCENGRLSGHWEFGGRLGPRERVDIEILGDSITIRNVTGRHCTQLLGKAAPNGTLCGEVVEDARGGGSFKLLPLMHGPIMRRLQECYVALLSGSCIDVLVHPPEMELPPECSICLQALAAGDVIVRTSCSSVGHVFHRRCIKDWFKSEYSCPVCRRLLGVVPRYVDKTMLAHVMSNEVSLLSYEMWRAQHP